MGPPQNSVIYPNLSTEIIEGLQGAADGFNNLIVEPTANFFESIVNFLSMFWDVVVGTFENTGALIRTIFTSAAVTNLIQPYIWAPIAASMTIVILIGVVKTFLYGGNT